MLLAFSDWALANLRAWPLWFPSMALFNLNLSINCKRYNVGIILMMREVTLFITYALALAGPLTTRAEEVCRIHKPGDFTGSCEALTNNSDRIDTSHHSLDRWAYCRQEKEHLPCGCTADVIFFNELILVWEKELSRYLKALNNQKNIDRRKLESGQKNWLLHRKKKEEDLYRENDQEGSYWGIQITFGRLELVRTRALELGCELEKSVRRLSNER